MPDDQSDDVQSAINQALPPEFRQAIAENMQTASESRTTKAPKLAPTPLDEAPAASPPTPAPVAVVPTPEAVVPTPTPPVVPIVSKPVAAQVKSKPSPPPAPPKPSVSETGPTSSGKPKELNEFVSQIEGELIPQTLDMLLADYVVNREKVHENLRLALWRLGELEMASSPQDLLHREAIGELAGKLKMLEIWAGRLDQKS